MNFHSSLLPRWSQSPKLFEGKKSFSTQEFFAGQSKTTLRRRKSGFTFWSCKRNRLPTLQKHHSQVKKHNNLIFSSFFLVLGLTTKGEFYISLDSFAIRLVVFGSSQLCCFSVITNFKKDWETRNSQKVKIWLLNKTWFSQPHSGGF